MKHSILTVAILLAALSLTGCGRNDNEAQPPKAKSVTIQFRRDALGSGADLPVSPTTDGINGAMVSMSGRLVLVNKEWVVLEQGKHDFWIPRDNILLIKIN